MITINPAKQLRIENRVGSLEVGKDADVVIWNHHPLSTFAIVDRVYIDGTVYYDRAGRRQAAHRNAQEKQTLVAAEQRATRRRADSARHAAALATTANRRRTERRLERRRAGAGYATAQAAAHATATRTGALGAGRARDHQRQDLPGHQPDDRARHHRHPRRHHRGGRARTWRCRPARQVIDAAGADVYPGWINGRTTIGLSDPGAGGFADADEMLDFNPHCARCRVPQRQRQPSRDARQRRHHGRGHARRRHARRPGRGHEPRRLHLGREHGPATAGISFQFPPLGQGSADGRPATYEDAEAGTRRQARRSCRGCCNQARAYMKAAARTDRPTGCSNRWFRSSIARLPLFTDASQRADIRDAVAFAERESVRDHHHAAGTKPPRRRRCSRKRTSRSSSARSSRLPTPRRMPPRRDVPGRGRAGQGRRQDRVRERRRQQRAAAARTTPRWRWRGACRATRRSRRSRSTPPRCSASPTASAASSPARIANLLIAKGDPLEIMTRDHARDHRRPRRQPDEQAPGALRALPGTAMSAAAIAFTGD